MKKTLQYLQSDLKKNIRSVYLFCGDEIFLREQALSWIKKRVLEKGSEDFNFLRFDGSQSIVLQLQEAVNTLPMMAERKLVICDRFEQLKNSELLESVLDSPNPSTVLVLLASQLDKRKKFFRKLVKSVEYYEFKTPYENEFPKWIQYIAKQEGLSLTEEQIFLMKELVGSSLVEIRQELKKLKSFLQDQPVTIESISNVISRSRVDSVFSLIHAIASSKKQIALSCLKTLLLHGQNEVSVVVLLSRHIRILGRLKEGLKQRKSDILLSSQFKIPPFFLREYKSQCSLWSENQIKEILRKLYRLDKLLKNNKPVSSRLLMEHFIISI